MKQDLNNQLPLEDLKRVGLVTEGTLTMEWENVNALKRGNMTNLVELKNIKGDNGFNIDAMNARLSVVDENGANKLRIDPVYKDVQPHPLLSAKEHDQLTNGEVPNVKKEKLDKEGNSVTEVIEFDGLTNQFISYDPRKIKLPEAINNETLSPDKKRKLRDGEAIVLSDGTEVQFRSSDQNGFRSNRNAMVLSLLLDGGLSYLLITGVDRLIGKETPEEKNYSKGYLTALNEVEKQLESRKKSFPNDPTITKGINQVKHEFSKASHSSPVELDQLSENHTEEIKNVLFETDNELHKKDLLKDDKQPAEKTGRTR